MSVGEHSLSYLLRNSGEVLDEVESRDVVLQRRDGEDLYLALLSRERGVRESLNVLARFLRAALRDEGAGEAIARWLSDELPWTAFLPPGDKQEFLEDFTRTAAACVEIDNFEPMVRALRGWIATAEAYADPDLAKRLQRSKKGPSTPLGRPSSPRATR